MTGDWAEVPWRRKRSWMEEAWEVVGEEGGHGGYEFTRFV